MDARKTVMGSTLRIAVGEGICIAVMLLVFLIIGKLDGKVLLGALLGTLVAVGNFFLMAVSVSEAADKAASQDVRGGQTLVRTSYILRLVGMFGILFAGIYFGHLNVFSTILPVAFVRWIIMVDGFFRRDDHPKDPGSDISIQDEDE